MKCPKCRSEVGNLSACPYCGATVYVSGAWVERIVGSVNFGEYESRMYFERTLRKAGVFDMLEARGIKEKDTVDVLGIQFEYIY